AKIVSFNYALARFNSDGSLDNNFSGDGRTTLDFNFGDDYAYAAALQKDGKIVLSGGAFSGSNYDFGLARFNSDGSLDFNFGVNGHLTTAFGSGNDWSSSINVQPDGKIVAAGT